MFLERQEDGVGVGALDKMRRWRNLSQIKKKKNKEDKAMATELRKNRRK